MHLANVTLLGLALLFPALAQSAKKVRHVAHLLFIATHPEPRNQNFAVSQSSQNARCKKSASSPPPMSDAVASNSAPAHASPPAPSPPTSNPAPTAKDAQHFPVSPSSKQASAPIPSSAVASEISGVQGKTMVPRSASMIPAILATLLRGEEIAAGSALPTRSHRRRRSGSVRLCRAFSVDKGSSAWMMWTTWIAQGVSLLIAREFACQLEAPSKSGGLSSGIFLTENRKCQDAISQIYERLKEQRNGAKKLFFRVI
ncbi:MAG: hypothetical protein Q9199_004823 [Rusavskia elegans]